MQESLTEDQKIRLYINRNPLMVLGTIDDTGNPRGAAVYVYALSADKVYFMTKKDTEKFTHIVNHPQVSVTIVNPTETSTLQATGTATVVNDPHIFSTVMEHINQIHATNSDVLPPISKLHAGPYEIVEIALNTVRLANFKGASIGDSKIFTTLPPKP